MVMVEKGGFRMGTPINSKKRKVDEIEHLVVIERDFYISRYEVSQRLFSSVMGYNPSKFIDKSKPVESVDWYEAVEFCNKLSKLSSLEPAYIIDKNRVDPKNTLERDRKRWYVELDYNANGYRLPTEEEWEFAARGGIKSKGYTFSGSNDPFKVALLKNDTGPVSLGSRAPNELGIYDMTGNVFEWCHSWYTSYNEDNTTGKRKVTRGGSWLHSQTMSRNSKRSYRRPDYGDEVVGFRVVR